MGMTEFRTGLQGVKLLDGFVYRQVAVGAGLSMVEAEQGHSKWLQGDCRTFRKVLRLPTRRVLERQPSRGTIRYYSVSTPYQLCKNMQ